MRTVSSDKGSEGRALLRGVAIALGSLYLVGFLVCREINDYFLGFCGNEEVRQVASPDGKLKLVEYLRDCGVGSEPARQFSVLPAAKPLPNEVDCVFSCDTERDWDPAVSHFPVQIRWLDSQRVEIAYPDRLEVFMHKPKAQVGLGWPNKVSVQIHAKPLPPRSDGQESQEDNGKAKDRERRSAH